MEHRDTEAGDDKKVNVQVRGEDHKAAAGLLNHVVSSFVSKVEAAGNDDDDKKREENQEEEEVEEKKEESKEGGGILDNLISRLVSPKAASGLHFFSKQVEEEEEKNFDEEDEKKVNNEEHSGILDNIVSHLPTPVSEDAVPTDDEASILIHSIVHD